MWEKRYVLVAYILFGSTHKLPGIWSEGEAHKEAERIATEGSWDAEMKYYIPPRCGTLKFIKLKEVGT